MRTPKNPKLTYKDIKILQSLADGHKVKQVSEVLQINKRTVEGRLEKMRDIFKVRTMGALIYQGYKQKFIF